MTCFDYREIPSPVIFFQATRVGVNTNQVLMGSKTRTGSAWIGPRPDRLVLVGELGSTKISRDTFKGYLKGPGGGGGVLGYKRDGGSDGA